MSASNVKVCNKRGYPAMSNKMMKQFIDLLEVPSSSTNEKLMDNYIAWWLSNRGYDYTIDIVGNIIVDKGSVPNKPCVVAHIDTVHEVTTTSNTIDKRIDKRDNHTILSSKTGIGGDDKCGIFACFHMLEQFNDIKIVFFTQEETGQVGSESIDLDIFSDCGYIIQLDRWGSSDFIDNYWNSETTNDDFNEIFKAIADDYGYKSASGLLTDSMVLFERNVGISCVNVSCGYYKHHTPNEYIDTNIFYNSLRFTKNLIKLLGNYNYKHEYAHASYKYNDWKYDQPETCADCGCSLFEEEDTYCDVCAENRELLNRKETEHVPLLKDV